VGVWRWLRCGCAVGYAFFPEVPALLLDYCVVPAGRDEQESFRDSVNLVAERTRFGGTRWLFVCPLVVNGVACRRRVANLYLPPGGRYFGCRACHNLTYSSAQTHDKRVDALWRNPELLAAITENPGAASDKALILALKAIRTKRR
jgi:hypothetical protein